jgi:hypothetical protein
MPKKLMENHKKFAVDCFNSTWDLLEKNNRSPGG